MKLLDLETGEYLKLGKDFYYGGDSIIIEPYNIASNIMSLFFECFKDANSINEGMIFLQKKALENKQNNISDDVIMNVLHQSEPQEPLKTLCEETGAVVYSRMYVLFLDQEMGSVYNIKNEYRGEEFIDYKCKNGDFSSGYNIYNNDIITFLGNFFEEYSKQLRNEPSKFDELKEFLK